MARVVNKEEHAERRNEIVDAAQRFIYSKGYQQMTIQDILESLQISKGAFYHYFGSKQALLEALVERTQQEAIKVLQPIVEDPDLPILEKLEHFFSTIAQWKTARKDYLMALLRIWYADDNAIVRQKMITAGAKWITPILARLIHQGTDEGVLHTSFPEQVGEVTVALMIRMGETIAEQMLALDANDSEEGRAEALREMEKTIVVYTDAIERVLGAPTGSLTLFDREVLKVWVA